MIWTVTQRNPGDIKSNRSEVSAVAPLRQYSNSIDKTNILNDQFTSVFPHEDVNNVPIKTGDKHPTALGIGILPNGVLKLLEDINPHKASDPDGMPWKLLKVGE